MALATRLVAQGRQADARRILELNAEQYPSSAGVAVELSRVLEALGERDRAIEQYRRALTIQPSNLRGVAPGVFCRGMRSAQAGGRLTPS